MYAVIVGCGAVGYHLTRTLLAAGHEVTVVERSPAKCELLRRSLEIGVVLGDGTNRDHLHTAGTSRADIFVGATDLDETNLVACQVAKHCFQVRRTMAVVRDAKNDSLFRVLGIDVAVNANHLLVTALEEGIPGQPLVHLMDTRAAGLELVSVSIPEDSSAVGRRLNEVVLPPNSIVTLVVKAEHAELPTADPTLESGDQVVVITTVAEELQLYDILTGV